VRQLPSFEAKILGPVERAEPGPDLAATSFFLVASRASKDRPAAHLARRDASQSGAGSARFSAEIIFVSRLTTPVDGRRLFGLLGRAGK
jgi:hypothetical protein